MKISFIHRWIFATIILIGAALPVDVLGASSLPIYQIENIATKKSLTKVIRYQKAIQIISVNPYFDFNFSHFLFQNNSTINNQFQYLTFQKLPFPIVFQSIKIITNKNTDNLLLLS